MLLRTLLTSILLAAGAFAQLSSFPKPSYFRETFSKTRTKVELKDPVRLQDFVVAGKLELSLKNFLALVMSNNTDIQIQMLTLETPKNAILRAFGAWDPLARATFTDTKSTLPSTSALDGAATLVSLTQPAQFSVNQTLPTGTNYTVGFGATKSTTNSGFSSFNPALSTTVSISFTQPLIKNRSMFINRLPLMAAKSRYRMSEYSLTNQLLTMVNAAENAYWDVIAARENLKVAENGRDVAAEFLKLSEKQLELGALSPLDIYNPQQQLATAELSVSQAKFALTQKEDALRKQISLDLDQNLRAVPIVLSETVDVAAPPLDTELEVSKALATRPDLKAATQSLDIDDLGIQSAKNGLLPNLSLTGSYQSQGRGGVFYQRSNQFGSTGTGTNTSTIVTTIPGGLSDALSQMFGFGYPVYSFGLNLNLPIKSRSAAADMADALAAKKRDALTERTTIQGIRLDILNAVSNVQGSVEQLKLAKLALDFAVKNLEAENKKYELGTEINQNVILAQNVKVQAESSVVVNQIGLRRNLLNLLTKTGELLDDRGIVVQ
ncbi:MAG TPA: TolC family protein [Candidatus Acidoferrales bacterium]|nr:TolC family protein [Candidatus Acidoferrales bacterium]